MTIVVAGAGLIGSLSSLALPITADTAEIAAILALGALALLAGHRWGLTVVVAADIVLLGKLWPLLVYTWPPSPATQVALYAALAAALPGACLLRRTAPPAVELILGRSLPPQHRAAAVWVAMSLSAAWLVFPAFG